MAILYIRMNVCTSLDVISSIQLNKMQIFIYFICCGQKLMIKLSVSLLSIYILVVI